VTETVNRHMSMDEILEQLSAKGRDPDAGADQFRALKMLASMDTASVAINPPMSQEELVARVARILRGVGMHVCQLAHHQAFPKNKHSFEAPVLDSQDLTEKDREDAAKVRTLKLLYRKFPEVKRPGFPPGYPAGKGLVAQQAWCQNAALKAMIDRRQREALAQVQQETPSDVIADAAEEAVPTAQE
jgi:acetolactate synthase regulatory subunit